MTTISIRSIDDLIALIPHQLGHHPADSLVLLATSGTELVVTARAALHEEAGPDPDPEGHARAVVTRLLAGAVRNGCDGAYAVVYESVAGDGDAVVDALARECADAGITVRDMAVVRDGRRRHPWSARRREREEGIVLPDPALCPPVVDCVVRGSAPLPDRAAITALVSEDPDAATPVSAALARVSPRGRAGRFPRQGALWARVLTAPEGRTTPEVTVAETARLLRSLTDVHWRDALIAWCAPGSLPVPALDPRTRRALATWLPGRPPGARVVLERLLWLLRATPDGDPATAVMGAVVGCVAWHHGEGAIARDALERALRADPGHRLARLGLQLVELGVRPDRGPRGGRDMDGALGRAV